MIMKQCTLIRIISNRKTIRVLSKAYPEAITNDLKEPLAGRNRSRIENDVIIFAARHRGEVFWG